MYVNNGSSRNIDNNFLSHRFSSAVTLVRHLTAYEVHYRIFVLIQVVDGT